MVEVFGLVAVSLMVAFYALEDRAPGYTLAFAVACLLASLYAALIRSWPFAAVELLWAGVALRRFWLRRPDPIAR